MKLERPRTVSEAVAAFARDPQSMPLAGGTDIMVAWNAGQLNGRSVLDLSRLSQWREIRRVGNGVRIGPLVTHAQLQRHPLVIKYFPLLAQASATVGAAQIQNRGTLGGNIANASPAGDTFPPLAVYEPIIHAVSPRGRRQIAFSGIFAGVKKSTLGSAELIEAVELPFLPRPQRQMFRKVGTRLAQAISKTVAAGLLWLDNGRVSELRFALGSMAPTVRRLKAAEAFLKGKTLDRENIAQALELLAQDVSPIDDIRSTAGYRLRVSQNILGRFLDNSHYGSTSYGG